MVNWAPRLQKAAGRRRGPACCPAGGRPALSLSASSLPVCGLLRHRHADGLAPGHLGEDARRGPICLAAREEKPGACWRTRPERLKGTGTGAKAGNAASFPCESHGSNTRPSVSVHRSISSLSQLLPFFLQLLALYLLCKQSLAQHG